MFFSNTKFYRRSFTFNTWCSNLEEGGAKGRDSMGDDSSPVRDSATHRRMLWLSFRFEAPLLNVSMTYAFSLFSHVLWPMFVPFSIGLVEETLWRKKAILVFQLIGIAVGLYLLYMIVKFPVWSEADDHIVYVSPHFYQVPVMMLYLAATTIASSFRATR